MALNFARFGPIFFGKRGQTLNFFYLNYKTEHTFYGVAKFHRDRPRDLGDLASKNRKKQP